MTEATVLMAAGCMLQIAEARLQPTAEGWVEELHLEVVADPTCARIELPLPPSASLGDHRARTRLGDGTGVRLGEERWGVGDPALDGTQVVTLYLPELLGGDRVVVDVQRELPPGPVAWRPGAARYWSAEVAGTGEIEATSAVTRHASKPRMWTSNAPADLEARVTAPEQIQAPAPEALGAPGDVSVTRRVTLQVPVGDPQIKLYPGGGSTTRVETFLVFPPGERVRGWVLPSEAGAEVSLKSEPSDAAELVRDAGVPRVRVEPTEAPVRVTLAWEQADAPTFGERPPDVDVLDVEAPGGAIDREGDAWRLVAVHERPVLPTREVLVRALQNRFRAVALPEPGAPTSLRGRDPTWELAADLRPVLLDRVAIATWPAEPLWPRRLVKARKTMVLTPTEAALTLWLYARQLRLDADWALVRPASTGPGPAQAPSGFTHALVRVTQDGESRWIDPTCRVCGPFELPPDLEGASVLGTDDASTPAASPGRHLVKVRDDEVEWQLEGPPALLLRQWLGEIPEGERAAAVAARIGGVGATLTVLEGLDQGGAPIRVIASRGSGIVVDPLSLPPPREDGSVWVPWVGERRIEWPDHDAPDATAEAGPLSWSRTRRDGRMVERLIVGARMLAADDISTIDQARYAAPADPE